VSNPEPKERPSGVRRSEAGLIEAVAVGAEQLLRSPYSEAATAMLIEQLGRAAKASRAYLFMIRSTADDLVADEKLEWVAPGIAPQIGDPTLQGLSFRDTGNDWLREKLEADEIVAGPTAEMPASFRRLLVQAAVASLILVPIRIGGKICDPTQITAMIEFGWNSGCLLVSSNAGVLSSNRKGTERKSTSCDHGAASNLIGHK
jgi:hypothetical protein